MPRLRFASIAIGLSVYLATSGIAGAPPGTRESKPMSFHDRVLLNRLAVRGDQSVEVLLAVQAGTFSGVLALIEAAGGNVRRSEIDVGYVRAELPIDRLVAFVADTRIEAYHISSLSGTTWYADARTEARADTVRNAEVNPAVRRSTAASPPSLPQLSSEAARQSGYTADDDVGIGRWRAEHPTFDGRGVTIAMLESGELEFGHPALQTAKTLEGREVPKIAGIVNAIDPEDRDDSRVDLDVEIHAASTWQQISGRTYILPRSGTYRFGLFTQSAGNNLVHQFGVLRDDTTGETRIDTNGDADFRDEPPVADANSRLDVRTLKIRHPRLADLSFVLTAGRNPNQVHLYLAKSSHHTMGVNVAAGSHTDDGLTVGVAPGARVLVVRYASGNPRFHNVVEGYLDTIRRPDVDVLCDATGITIVPDTAGDFAGLFFSRLVATYHKPIFHAANNDSRVLNSASSAGNVFSVGGAVGPATFASLYGPWTIPSLMVAPASAAGPALDGALKPDFLAPENRISVGARINDVYLSLPRHAPVVSLPVGYAISCCTSASSPYAAGVGALLVSAAKQSGLAYSRESLGRALRVGAQFLGDWPAYQQGNGVLDVNAAWRELQRTVEVPRIDVSGNVVHALSGYSPRGSNGVGLFEQSGWTVGARGQRTLRFRRTSGPSHPVTYRLSWTGNDGTFQTKDALTLLLNSTVDMSIAIAVHEPGAHSAMLNLHDPSTDAIVLRSMATIVAPEPSDATTGTVRVQGSLSLLRSRDHFFDMPAGVDAMRVELEVVRGAVEATVTEPDGLYRSYYGHVRPMGHRTFSKGTYTLILPNPAEGMWSINVSNVSAWLQGNTALVSTDEAEYAISMEPLDASLKVTESADGGLAVDLFNQRAALREPVMEVSEGTLRSHHAEALPTGLPNQFNIDVPADTFKLALELRSTAPSDATLELHLYDCTSGECFSWDFTLPAAHKRTVTVPRPSAGRWIAAVNAAPIPARHIKFTLDEIITAGAERASVGGSRPTGARWTEMLPGQRGVLDMDTRTTHMLLCELIDAATERDAVAQKWENRAGLPELPARSVAVGRAVVLLK